MCARGTTDPGAVSGSVPVETAQVSSCIVRQGQLRNNCSHLAEVASWSSDPQRCRNTERYPALAERSGSVQLALLLKNLKRSGLGSGLSRPLLVLNRPSSVSKGTNTNDAKRAHTNDAKRAHILSLLSPIPRLLFTAAFPAFSPLFLCPWNASTCSYLLFHWAWLFCLLLLLSKFTTFKWVRMVN
jgi:hypothetical protein